MTEENKIITYTPEYLDWYDLYTDIPWLRTESLEASNIWGFVRILWDIDGLSSRIEQNEWSIELEVTNRTNADNVLQSNITVEADRITQEVTARQNWDIALQSSITIEADRITQEVTNRTNADNILQTSITQTADEIVLKASDSAWAKASAVVSSINWGTVVIDAKNIQINGTTTFSSWYDPTTKETPAWAQSKADSALSSANSYTDALQNSLWDIAYLDLVWAAKLDTTVIQWGYIKTSLINASALAIWDFSWDIWDLDWNLDDISDGGTYKRVTSNEKTGADRAYWALNSSDRYTNWLASDDITETKSTSWYTGVFIDSTWLKWYDWWTKKFEIDASTWDAFFSWEIWGTWATITWDVEITSWGSLFVWGTWTGMFIENTTSWPGLSFFDGNQSAGFIIGNSSISVTVWSYSWTLQGIEITKSLVVNQDLVVNDDLVVVDQSYFWDTLNMSANIDMWWNNLQDVDNLYLNDIYAQWSFVYVRDPMIFSWSSTTLTIPTWTLTNPEQNWTATIYYNNSTNRIWIYDGGWKWTDPLV